MHCDHMHVNKSQRVSDANQYQYLHSVIQESDATEPYTPYTNHKHIMNQKVTKCQQYHHQYSQQTQHLNAQNVSIHQQLQSTIKQLQRVQTAHKMFQKHCTKIEQMTHITGTIVLSLYDDNSDVSYRISLGCRGELRTGNYKTNLYSMGTTA
eukprot:302397_1